MLKFKEDAAVLWKSKVLGYCWLQVFKGVVGVLKLKYGFGALVVNLKDQVLL